MPSISQVKKDKISEQILHYLYSISPESAFTNQISREIARDEEFTKHLLLILQSKKLIILISKNPQGKSYIRRQRWSLSSQAYDAYKKHQSPKPQANSNYQDEDAV